MSTHVTIAARFCGPPRSGNGGYCAGLAAAGLDGPVEVTLRRPLPLDQRLYVERGDTVVLRHGQDVLVEARPARLTLDVPPAPSFGAAEAMSRRFTGFARHAFPTCFVCGPAREPGDGLRIFPGPALGDGLVGAAWIPDASLADAGGRIRPEMLWAALDCPGYFAVAAAGQTALLGRMTGQLDAPVVAGERCIVVGWPIARSGRKLTAGTALYDADGGLRGRSLQTWLAV